MYPPKTIECVVIFGGGGLVGMQIARRVCQEFAPQTLVICSLTADESQSAVLKLRKEFPHLPHLVAEAGNIFVRQQLAQLDANTLAASSSNRWQLFEDMLGPISDEEENIGQQDLMGQLIMKYRPDVVVDCVNTATGISYQEVKTASFVARDLHQGLANLMENMDSSLLAKAQTLQDPDSTAAVVNWAQRIFDLCSRPLEAFPHLNHLQMVELMLVSQAIPQLVRHVLLLHRALVAAKTRMYVKVGTTGTGGMGINIPYTHGEDRPSFNLMSKSSVGFAHTGLLFLLARTPAGPIIKEIKPGAMIGHRGVSVRPIKKFRRKVLHYQAQTEVLGQQLVVKDRPENYQNGGQLSLVCIDTGENGLFSRGEFEAITFLNQMEFITPEEIARNVIYEIVGGNTGKDVIAAIDGAVMNPSYRAGYIRQDAINQMQELENQTQIPSVAIGELGPPQLSKFLYEAHLLSIFYPQLADLVAAVPTEMSEQLATYLQQQPLRDIIISLGMAILLPDGERIWRGPYLQIPETSAATKVAIASAQEVDRWAQRGWVDLRVANMQVWQQRAVKMQASAQGINTEGSAGHHHRAYHSKQVRIGEMVGWIFINEFGGRRVMG